MSDGYTVYILKHLECEQLPLLLSHQVSYTLYKLLFYYQRNVSLSLLTPAGLGFASLAPKVLPTCRLLRLSTVHHPRLWQPGLSGASQLGRNHVKSIEHRLFLEPLIPKC